MQKLINRLKPTYSKILTIWHKFKLLYSVNWTKTLYFNFKMLPLESARKLPILFYGKVKFTSLSGKLIIEEQIKYGLVRFGINLEMLKVNQKKSEIRIDGTFNIKGSLDTGNDYSICILPNSILEIGGGSYLGAQTKIIATNHVKIGKGFRFGYESQMSDSNYHYTIDLETKKVSRFNGIINIGDYCWVGNRSSIMKGTVTPCNLIIASNSLLNKDYTLSVAENSLIGGTPAKLIKTNIVRIYNPELEQKISRYLIENAHEEYYQLEANDNYLTDN